MVWDELTDHLAVVWGAMVALGIVLVLTPAVGSAARYLRLVGRSNEPERAGPQIPRLGGLAIFFGVLVPSLAFLPLGGELRGVLLGAAVATTVGAIDDFRGLAWWQKLAGQVTAAIIPTGFGVWVHSFTFPLVGVHALPEWVGAPADGVRDRRRDEHGQLPRRARRPGGRGLRDLRRDVRRDRAVARRGRRGDPVGDRLRCLPRVPARELLSGQDLHGRLRGAAARVHAGRRLGAGPLENRRVGDARPAAPRTRRAGPRHVVRRRQAHPRAASRSTSPMRATCTIGCCGSASRSAARCCTCGRGAARSRSPHSRHASRRRTSTAAGMPTTSRVDVAAGLLAIGFSTYVVGLLELVKLSSVRPRRRSRPPAEERKSA